MGTADRTTVQQRLDDLPRPWFHALADSPGAQRQAFTRLLERYGCAQCGRDTQYAPAQRALDGSVDLADTYGATEHMFGQQKDEHRAWSPHCDLFLFEVQTAQG